LKHAHTRKTYRLKGFKGDAHFIDFW